MELRLSRSTCLQQRLCDLPSCLSFRFCQGSTKLGLGFESFYGDCWEEGVEDKFRQWAVRIFGGTFRPFPNPDPCLTYSVTEKGSERRRLFLLPPDLAAPSGSQTDSSSQNSPTNASSQNSPTNASSQNSPTNASSHNLFTEPSSQSSFPEASTQNTSTKAAPRKKSKSQPSKPRKKGPQPPVPTTTPRAVATPELPHSTLNPTSNSLAPHLPIDPPASTFNTNGDMAAPGELITVDPSQLIMEPSQLIVEPSCVTPEPQQSVSEHSEVPTNVPMDTQPDVTAVLTPPEALAKVVNATPDDPVPGVRYRVPITTTVASGGRSRRNSIDGAPEMVVDVVEEEIPVDLSDYINMDSDNDDNDNGDSDNDNDNNDNDNDNNDNDNNDNDNNDNDSDNGSQISSSQKTADGCQDLSPPPPNSRQEHTGVGTTGGNTGQPDMVSGRSLPKLKVDEADFPTWMTKKGQWKYLTSTTGGTAWENLLKAYINQERRLEFTEMVSDHTRIFLSVMLNHPKGSTLTNEGRPSKIKEYFQYAHQPSRGDTLKVPDFGAEVAEWWEKIQPEWRRSKHDPPQDPNRWSYILSGGSKGAFLVILCLAWWDRSHERHIEEQKRARRSEAGASGVTATFVDIPDHDAGWLNIVNDVAFVMQKARDCPVPARGTSSPSRAGKRKRQEDSVTSPQAPAVKRSSRKRTKV